FFFFFSSRRRHTRFSRDWSSDVCSSDLSALVSVRSVGKASPTERTLTSAEIIVNDIPQNDIKVAALAAAVPAANRAAVPLFLEIDRKSVVEGEGGDLGGCGVGMGKWQER